MQFNFNQAFGHHAEEVQQLLYYFDEGKKARLVGGVIRDQLMGLETAKPDIDIAVAVRPDSMIKTLSGNSFKVTSFNSNYGVLRVQGQHYRYDLTSLRQDIDCFGRAAKVDFTPSDYADWQTDSMRRDFTFNALYADVNGVIDDFHHGIEAIKHKQIHFIGNPQQRIKEDWLRLLRYIRFHAKFDCHSPLIFKPHESLKHGLHQLPKGLRVQEWQRFFDLNCPEAVQRALYSLNQLDLLSILCADMQLSYTLLFEQQFKKCTIGDR